MRKFECEDGTVITYRLPNVIEYFHLKGVSNWGKEDNGYLVISSVLANAEKFIEKVEGKKDWEECINTRSLFSDLSKLAIELLKDEVAVKEKKRSKSSGKT